MPIAIEPGLDADEFCLRLRQNIKAIGLAKAFGTGDLVVLYSGPSKNVADEITTAFTGNWQRSKDQAMTLGGRRIDDTLVGTYLTGLDLQGYFIAYYGASTSAIKEAELKVWACASTEFMRAKFRLVATAVCGAAPDRVFRKYEIGSVIKNRGVKKANSRPMQLFRDFFAIDPYETYRLFCITELIEARQTARKENTKEAWNDYRERRKFFIIERRQEVRYGTKVSAATKTKIKLDKKRALLAYSFATVVSPSRAAPVHRKSRVKRIAP